MPRDGAGNYSRLRRWTTDRSGGIPFSAERTDEDADDIAAAVDAIDGDLTALDARVEALEDAGTPTAAAIATIVVTASTTPPSSPTDAAKYLVLPTATGTWATHDNRIATYASAGASYSYSAAPTTGSMVIAQDTHSVHAWDGSAWLQEGPTRKTGTAAFSATTAVAVTFTEAFVNGLYQVSFEPMSNHNFWVSGKTAAGFTLNCSGAISSSVNWTAVL